MSTCRRLCSLFLALCSSAIGPSLVTGQEPSSEPLPVVRIALLEDGLTGESTGALDGLRREIREVTAGLVRVEFPATQHRVSDGTLSGVARELAALRASEEFELLIAVGPLGSELLCRSTLLRVPSIAMQVLDGELQRAPFGGPGSGVRNLNYLVAPLNLASDVESYRELLELETVQLVVHPRLAAALPEFVQGVRLELEAQGLRVGVDEKSATASSVLDHIDEHCDAVLLSPLAHFGAEEAERLTTELMERGVPSFSLIGSADVRRGLLGSRAPENGFEQLAKRTAINLARILGGEAAEDLSTTIGGEDQLVINGATALRLGLRPRFDVLAEAEVVGVAPPEGEQFLSLASVMREAQSVDRNLLAAEMELLSRSEDLAEARASLLPQLDLLASWTVIDEEQASLGRAERTVTGRLSGTQVIYSEGLGAQVDIERALQESREADLLVQSLNVVQAAATAYLNVLRAKSLDRIRRQDLRLSRSNLELARARNEIGLSGPAEVYRWESRIATSRRSVLDAQADLRVAEIEVNRVLHRPLGASFRAEEVGADDRGHFIDARLERYIENPWDFEVLLDYLIQEGLALSPELASLDSALRAQERALTSTRRAYWQPIVSLDGSIADVLSAEGTGSQIPPGFSGIIPDPQITTWSASLIGSFPLLTGGAKSSRERRARHELIRLRYLRAASAQFIEQGIRSQLHSAVASFAGIRLSRAAAEAAKRSLELVIDSYSNGVVAIIDVLEAQNAALIADESAASAVYDFALDMVELQRAVGQYSSFSSEAERDQWFAEFERFAGSYLPTLSR